MDIDKIIKELKRLPEPRKTYLEILKVHQKEVPIANLLAFFFRPNEKHGLDFLFIRWLLETQCYDIGDKPNPLYETPKGGEELVSYIRNLKDAKVRTEVSTDKTTDTTKYIDILIETKEIVICIEFKINHDLDNPLDTYQSYIKEQEKEYFKKTDIKRKLIFIVLTPYKKEPSQSIQKFITTGKNEFKTIILSHFIKNISDALSFDYYKNNVDNIYLQYLNDFIQTINNRKIRYYQSILFDEIQKLLNNNRIENKLHYKSYGSFLQIKLNYSILKLRIENSKWLIEEWQARRPLDFTFKKSYPPIELENFKEVIDKLKFVS